MLSPSALLAGHLQLESGLFIQAPKILSLPRPEGLLDFSCEFTDLYSFKKTMRCSRSVIERTSQVAPWLYPYVYVYHVTVVLPTFLIADGKAAVPR